MPMDSALAGGALHIQYGVRYLAAPVAANVAAVPPRKMLGTAYICPCLKKVPLLIDVTDR